MAWSDAGVRTVFVRSRAATRVARRAGHLEPSVRARLRAEHADYFDVPDAARNRDEWIRYVLADLLGWSDLVRSSSEMPELLALEIPEYGESIRPSFGLVGRDGALRLLGLICDGLPTGRVIESSWAASPADRLARMMRRNGVSLGLATDGRSWVLISAPHDRATTEAVFDASLWREEPDLLRAFVSLLCRARFFGVPDEETLAALLEQSKDNPGRDHGGPGHPSASGRGVADRCDRSHRARDPTWPPGDLAA